MKKTNQRSRTDPHNRNETGNYQEEATPERSKQHSKQPPHKHGMMCKQV